jgi:hypothetical protein
MRVTKVSQDVCDAQADMEDLSEKLISLEDYIETLRHDFQNPAVYSPDRQKKHPIKMTDDCNRITVEMLAFLTTLMSAHEANNSPWTNTNIPKFRMVKIQHMLEADRSAIAYCDGTRHEASHANWGTEPARSGSIALQQLVTGPGSTPTFTRPTVTEFLTETKAVKALAFSVYLICKSGGFFFRVQFSSQVTPSALTQDHCSTFGLPTQLKRTKADVSQMSQRWDHMLGRTSTRRRSKEPCHSATSSSANPTRQLLDVHTKSLSIKSG